MEGATSATGDASTSTLSNSQCCRCLNANDHTNATARGFSSGDGVDTHRSLDNDSNVHWGDYKVLKRCLVKRWKDITKTETCLHSLWAKRKYLEETLADSQSQMRSTDRSLAALSAAVDVLSKDIDEQQQRCGELDRDMVARQAHVDAVVQSTSHAHSAPCPCRRLTAATGSDSAASGAHIRSLVSSVSGLKSQQSDMKRNLDVLRAQLNCKLTERLSGVARKEHLDKVIQQVTRNLLVVNDECQVVSDRWKEYHCQVEKLQTQMVEQWGPSALDRLIPANASRSRFF